MSTAPARSPTRPPHASIRVGGRVGERAGAGSAQAESPYFITSAADRCSTSTPLSAKVRVTSALE